MYAIKKEQTLIKKYKIMIKQNQTISNVKRRINIENIFFLFLSLFLLCFSSEIFSQTKKQQLKKIVIDPGHGGRDPGAVGKKSYEKTIVLAISKKLGNLIKKHYKDVEIIYTRTDDSFVALDKRADMANEKNADLLISIHTNANKLTTAYGASTYVMGLDRTQENIEVSLRENSVISFEKNSTKYERFDPKSPEAEIIFSLIQNTILESSLSLAAKVQKHLKKAERLNRGVKQAPLVVLWNATMPSILIETGFISNEKEEKYLMSKKGQNTIAKAIFDAFVEYKKENEKNFNTEKLFEKEEINYVVIESNIQKKKNTRNLFEKKVSNKRQEEEKDTLKKEKPREIILKNEIFFKIQICFSDKKLPKNSKKFKGFTNVKEYKKKKIYKYTLGNTQNLKEAVKLKNEIRKKIPDAFVIAFKKEKRISISQAKKELNLE